MTLVDWLFPKRCLGCGEIGEYLCAGCVNKLVIVKQSVCPECLKFSRAGRVHPVCRNQDSMDGLTAMLEYRGLTKRMIKTYKDKYVASLTNDLVEIMSSMGDWEAIATRAWVVMGVPLSPRREKWQGFNQAEKLAKGIAKYAGWKYEEKILMRKETLNGRARVLMSKDRIMSVKNREVLLVDDVWLTGATMKECAKFLKRNGVKTVWGLTLARAV